MVSSGTDFRILNGAKCCNETTYIDSDDPTKQLGERTNGFFYIYNVHQCPVLALYCGFRYIQRILRFLSEKILRRFGANPTTDPCRMAGHFVRTSRI